MSERSNEDNMNELENQTAVVCSSINDNEYFNSLEVVPEPEKTLLGERKRIKNFIGALYNLPLELGVECQCLPRIGTFSYTDPFCVLSTRANRFCEWEEVGTTEKLVNYHYPRFVKRFRLRIREDKDMNKNLMVEVFGQRLRNKASLIGHGTCTVADIVYAPKRCFETKMVSRYPLRASWMFFTADVAQMRGSDRPVSVYVKLNKSLNLKKEIFFILNRSIDTGLFMPVYRSESKLFSNSSFSPARLSYAELFSAQEVRPLRMEFLENQFKRDPKVLGFAQLSIQNMRAMRNGSTLQWFELEGSQPGTIVLTSRKIKPGSIKIWLTVK